MAKIIVQTVLVLIARVAFCCILNWDVAMADVGHATISNLPVSHDHDIPKNNPAGLSLGRKLLQENIDYCYCDYDCSCGYDCGCDPEDDKCVLLCGIGIGIQSPTPNASKTLKSEKGKPASKKLKSGKRKPASKNLMSRKGKP